ncbi:aspartate-semialdehyde dehydrogenase [bacterium]|nr:MAG: aspartate-semialdehyde dehydrogenase [bacterium]
MRTAILGATGLVGRTMLDLLAQQDWLTGEPLLVTSSRSAGTTLPFLTGELACRPVDETSFDNCDLALFSAGSEASRRWAPVARKAGVRVVDNSSAFRQESGSPLVVPEINGDLLSRLDPGGAIIANPNCSTIQIALAVAPLVDLGLREVHATTLQAVSGGGQQALDELVRQQAGAPPAGNIFPRPMAGNVLPAIGAAQADGSYEEETKVGRELRRILGRDDDLAVTCTAIRVPVVNGHSAALRVVCDNPITPAEAVAALADQPSVQVTADPHDFTTPREANGRREVFVGRVRQDPANPRALLMWVVADNLLKGAAWNAVQIAAVLAGGTAV